jgi:3-oxoacyl-[acyl-carrier protein] reductase
MEIDLAGRRALVTGGGQGVGRGIAHGFAEAGAEVVVNDIDADRAETVAAQIRQAGGRAATAVFDVTDYRAVTDGLGKTGPIDVLVNNAGNAGGTGWQATGTFVDTEPSDWEPFLRVNLYGTLHCSRAALPGMVARGWGRVITIVSDVARAGGARMAAYAASKAGVAGLTRALAVEVGRYGVTVNNISLGTMRTEQSALWDTPDDPRAAEILRRYVIRRPGTPDDAAALAVFLGSAQAEWITGQTYPLNGGYSFAL